MKRQRSETDTVEFHILPHKSYGQATQKIKTAQSKTAHVESKEVSSFPADANQLS